MLVRCEHNTLQPFVADPAVDEWLRSEVHVQELPLVVGRTYVVYAHVSRDGKQHYYVCDEVADEYPKPYASAFFSVLDPRPSNLWIERETAEGLLVTFPEWADDPLYYEHLLDGEEAEIASFERARTHMDLEFARPDISMTASALDPHWVQCPRCEEAWEPNPGSALVRCPNRNCAAILRRA